VLFSYWIHFVFPLVIDICVLQPPIDTLGEDASTSQVLPKGPVVRACWCTFGAEPWVCPYANTKLVWSHVHLRLMNQHKIVLIGHLTRVQVNIYGVCSMEKFEVIEIVDDSQPYPTLMGLKWDFDN
jgi:hypothetical protein